MGKPLRWRLLPKYRVSDLVTPPDCLAGFSPTPNRA
jgi:hypothetical protein